MFEPELGRWFTPDPYEQHWSPYVGMGNNPISRVDPDGGFDQCPEEGDSQDCEDGNSETYINGRWIQDAIVQTEKNDYAIISVFENENKLSKWERFKEWFSNLFSKEKSTRKEKTTYTFGLVLRASKGGKDQPDLPEAKYTWTIEDFDVLTDVLGVLQMNDRVFEFKKINKTTKPFILKLSKKEFSKLMSGKIISSSKREYYSKITNQYKLHKSDIKKANYSSYSENSKLIKSKEDFFDEVGRTLGENAFSQAGNSLYNDYQLEISQDKYDTIQFKNGVIDIQGTPGNIDVIYKNGIPIDTDYWTPSPK